MLQQNLFCELSDTRKSRPEILTAASELINNLSTLLNEMYKREMQSQTDAHPVRVHQNQYKSACLSNIGSWTFIVDYGLSQPFVLSFQTLQKHSSIPTSWSTLSGDEIQQELSQLNNVYSEVTFG